RLGGRDAGGANRVPPWSARDLAQQCPVERSLFFFQAEDGIRDLTVTGVQTCALPICLCQDGRRLRGDQADGAAGRHGAATVDGQIGRASCRERVWISVVGG